MKWLLGGFSQAWNRRYKRTGHVFQGRYKSIPVAGERAADPYHFRIVADYIHLNPARAKIAGGTRGSLLEYRWSSLPAYAKGKALGKGAEWLVFDRVLDAFALAKNGRGRKAYVEWLEIRAREDHGRLPDEAMQALQRGWYLGEDRFRDKLLALLEKGAKVLKAKGSHSGLAMKSHGEDAAEKIVQSGFDLWDMSEGMEKAHVYQKSDPQKVAIAIVIKQQTNVSNIWIAARLGMGHDRSVSRLVKNGKENDEIIKLCKKLEKKLPCEQQPPRAGR
jgi:hypothetical protein